MKIKHKKLLASGTALALVGVLGIGSLLQSSVSVQASSEMMPGIEQIIGEASESQPFRILEIVDSLDEAQIGYYVSGQEPYIKLYEYTDKDGNKFSFSDLEEGLSRLPQAQRREFATNQKQDAEGNVSSTGKNIEGICGDAVAEFPLSYSEYQERYFAKEEDGWTKIDFVDSEGNPRIDSVQIKGSYQENATGTGDYTKQEQMYYPIRRDVTEDGSKADKYRENIKTFYYSDGEEAQAPYKLIFREVENEEIKQALRDPADQGKLTILPEYDYTNGKYGYYENVYADLTEKIAEDIAAQIYLFPGENPSVEEAQAVLIQDNTPQDKKAFSAGNEEEFSAVEDGTEVAEPQAVNVAADAAFGSSTDDSFSTEVFSAGEFSSESADVINVGESDQSMQEETSEFSEVNEQEDAVEAAQPRKERVILIGFKDEATKGSTANPYIYLGETIEAYPYYKYTLVGDLEKIKELAADTQKKDEQNLASGNPVTRVEKDITLEDGQYWYWQIDPVSKQIARYPLSIVTGRQAVEYSDIRMIDERLDYNYYYTVEKAYFCCKSSVADPQLPTDYQYEGWYYAAYPQNEDEYLKVDQADGKTATHYISSAEYRLTPEIGDHDFLPDESQEEHTVEVDHMYYQGGYVNHDWLKRYVFHLDPINEKEEFEKFAIQVDTVTATQFNEKYNGFEQENIEAQAAGFDDPEEEFSDGEVSEVTPMISEAGAELVSISDAIEVAAESEDPGFTDVAESESGAFADIVEDQEDTFSAGESESVKQSSTSTALAEYDLIYLNTSRMGSSAANVLISSELPCVIHASKAAQDPEFTQKFAGFVKEDADGHYVNTYVYFFKNSDPSVDDLVNMNFHTNFYTGEQIGDGSASETEGFEEILTYIETENQYRQIGTAEIGDGTEVPLLTKELSQARAIEYIINYKYKREISYKDSVKVLEITPDKDCSQITVQDVSQWLGEGNTSSEKAISIESVSACHSHSGQGGEKLLNDDRNDIWHSPYQNESNWQGRQENTGGYQGHYLDIVFRSASNVSGFTYQPRQDSKNGVLKKYTAVFYDSSDIQLQVVTGATGLVDNAWNREITAAFGTTVSNVKRVRLYFTETLAQDANNKSQFASGAKISFFDTSDMEWREITSVTACDHEQGTGEEPARMLDGNPNTFWHSAYNKNGNSETNNGHRGHSITITLSQACKVNGFIYQPRQDSGTNGVLTEYAAEFYDENGVLLDTVLNGRTGLTSSDSKRTVELMFGRTIDRVKTIQLYFTKTLSSTQVGAFASCAELRVFYAPGRTSVSIDSMTASEFAGHTEDIISVYDMIYISDQKNSSSDKFITGAEELRYSHVGASVGAISSGDGELFKLLGQLDNEYDTSYDGRQEYLKRFAPVSTFSEHGGGYFRGSGNDITRNQCKKLLDFVKSGYPVILATGLVNGNGSINASEVDTASYYYEFMNKAIQYDNVVTKEELDTKRKDITFFSKLAKPMIIFAANGKPKEPARANDSVSDPQQYGNISGELKFVFSVKNDSDALPAVTTYDCNLYLDLNFDGNLSTKEVQDQYAQIMDEQGNVLTQKDYGNGDMRYELKAGTTYTLTRKIPADYYKLITWKLQISSNRNAHIYTSQTGYAKQGRKEGEAKQTINVLQLTPEKLFNWDLKNSSLFQQKIQQLEDFEIRITQQTVSSINSFTSAEQTQQWVQDTLNKQQMLILGFADVYQDISNKYGQVDEILKFVRTGKSIIFAHDTTSYVNYDYNEMCKDIVQTTYGEGKDKIANVYTDTYLLYTVSNPTWGLSLNQVLRSIVGMDRYGITSDQPILSEGGDRTIGDILKQGNELHVQSSSVSFKRLMEVAGDIAYQTGGDRTSSYAQTQSYTNNLLNRKKMGMGDTLVTSVTKVNDGAITQYPYRIADTITVAQTHGQYYQLALEQDYDSNNRSDGESDIVVWYCLGGNNGSSVYDSSPNDARNNYYLYSKGNVIYTGAGHHQVDGEEEINLFINAIVAAANVAAAAPEVEFVKSLNPAAEVEQIRYYMTDQMNWTSSEANVVNADMDFYVNVKDYNMVSMDLTQGDLDSQEMTLDFYIQNENSQEMIAPDGSAQIKVTNLNQEISSLQIYGKQNEAIQIGEDGSFHFKDNNAYGLRIADIERYLKAQDQSGYREQCKIYVKVTSTVSLYGTVTKRTSWTSIDLKQRQLFDLD